MICRYCDSNISYLRYRIVISEEGEYSLVEGQDNTIEYSEIRYHFYCPVCDALLSTSLQDIIRQKYEVLDE